MIIITIETPFYHNTLSLATECSTQASLPDLNFSNVTVRRSHWVTIKSWQIMGKVEVYRKKDMWKFREMKVRLQVKAMTK